MSEKTEICPDCEGSGRIHIAGGSAGCINCGRSGYISRPIAEPTEEEALPRKMIEIESELQDISRSCEAVQNVDAHPLKYGNGGEVGTPRNEEPIALQIGRAWDRSYKEIEKERDEWRTLLQHATNVLTMIPVERLGIEMAKERQIFFDRLNAALAAYELKAKEGV